MSELPEHFPNGMPTKEPSVFCRAPDLAGRPMERSTNAIDYMLTADFAILDLASSRSSEFLFKAWSMARSNIDCREQESCIRICDSRGAMGSIQRARNDPPSCS